MPTSSYQRTVVALVPVRRARSPIERLAPGFGAQGATAADLTGRFGAVAHNVLASESRSILAAGPDAIAETIRTRNARYQEVLRG